MNAAFYSAAMVFAICAVCVGVGSIKVFRDGGDAEPGYLLTGIFAAIAASLAWVGWVL